MNRHQLFTLSPYKMTAVYLAFGIAWIGSTDWLVISLFESPETITFLQTIKGWLFVGLSAVLIFGLTSKRHQQVAKSNNQLERATEQFQVMHRILRHNIRNDITIIQGYVRNVEEQTNDTQQQSQLQTARRTAGQITSVSEKMQILDKLDLTPAPADSRVDLVELTNAEIRTFLKVHPDVSISVSAPETAHIQGDLPLHQALQEILENAVTHSTQSADEIEIDIEIVQTAQTVKLVVRDNGPGISRAELAPIEANEETALAHMSGVGLWLTKWLTEYYGGELYFDSDPTTGTTVTFEFEAKTPFPVIDQVSQTFKEASPAVASSICTRVS